MPRYYFDIRDGEELIVDDEGADMSDLEAVQMEAAQSLAEMARHAVWSRAEAKLGRRLGIEVRDENGSILQAKFTFEIEQHKQ
jgi:uncharacterized protein DUF6894